MRIPQSMVLAFALLVSAFAGAAALPEFSQPNAVWNQDVSDVSKFPLRSNSTQMMAHVEALALAGHGDGIYWGGDSHNNNSDFQIDFSFYVLHANASTPTKPVVAWPDADSYYNGECDDPGFQFPVPAGGGIEGTGPPEGPSMTPTYSCHTGDDCHLLVVNDTTHIDYESYSTFGVDGTGVHTTCGLYWDLRKVYPRYGRGEHCTSADGAGFPIEPLLFNADEVWSAAQVNGDLGHAIRFIIGNSRMQQGKHVHPSSHGTSATSDTDVNAMPYGSRLRLKAGFDITHIKGAATNARVQVLLRTLKKYGMFLSDGGLVPLTAESDYYNTHKWDDADLDIDSHSLWGIRPSDFEVVDTGDPISNSGNCQLTPPDFIFIDDFQF